MVANNPSHVQSSLTCQTTTFLIEPKYAHVTYSRAKPQQTSSVEKHAHPTRVVYCAVYLTLTRFTKFRVWNLHITSTQYAADTLHQHIFQRRLSRHITSPSEKTRPESWPGDYMGKATPFWQLSSSHRCNQM